MLKFHFELEQSNDRITVYLNGGIYRILLTYNKQHLSVNMKDLYKEIEHLRTYAKVTVKNEDLITRSIL